jgi:ankyrin repeat protein
MDLAILNGHPSIVVLLLDAGYPIDGPVGIASRPTPPILNCPSWATAESIEIMTLLLERGADPDIEWISSQNDHWWALKLATNNMLYDQVALLLKSGANPNRKCSDPTHPGCSGLTPLEQAKRRRSLWADPEFDFHHEVEMTPALRRKRIKAYQKMIDLYEKYSRREASFKKRL